MEKVMRFYGVRLTIAKHSEPIAYASLIRALGCPSGYNDKFIFTHYQTPAWQIFHDAPVIDVSDHDRYVEHFKGGILDHRRIELIEADTTCLVGVMKGDVLRLRGALNPYIDLSLWNEKPAKHWPSESCKEHEKMHIELAIGHLNDRDPSLEPMPGIMESSCISCMRDTPWIDVSVTRFFEDDIDYYGFDARAVTKANVELVYMESLDTIAALRVFILKGRSIGGYPPVVCCIPVLRMHNLNDNTMWKYDYHHGYMHSLMPWSPSIPNAKYGRIPLTIRETGRVICPDHVTYGSQRRCTCHRGP